MSMERTTALSIAFGTTVDLKAELRLNDLSTVAHQETEAAGAVACLILHSHVARGHWSRNESEQLAERLMFCARVWQARFLRASAAPKSVVLNSSSSSSSDSLDKALAGWKQAPLRATTTSTSLTNEVPSILALRQVWYMHRQDDNKHVSALPRWCARAVDDHAYPMLVDEAMAECADLRVELLQQARNGRLQRLLEALDADGIAMGARPRHSRAPATSSKTTGKSTAGAAAAADAKTASEPRQSQQRKTAPKARVSVESGATDTDFKHSDVVQSMHHAHRVLSAYVRLFRAPASRKTATFWWPMQRDPRLLGLTSTAGHAAPTTHLLHAQTAVAGESLFHWIRSETRVDAVMDCLCAQHLSRWRLIADVPTPETADACMQQRCQLWPKALAAAEIGRDPAACIGVVITNLAASNNNAHTSGHRDDVSNGPPRRTGLVHLESSFGKLPSECPTAALAAASIDDAIACNSTGGSSSNDSDRSALSATEHLRRACSPDPVHRAHCASHCQWRSS
jgi:hypothetical protein